MKIESYSIKKAINCAFHLIALSAVILAGCVSPMCSPVPAERMRGLSKILSSDRIYFQDAELVLKLTKDPDREVRMKAFEVFLKRRIRVDSERVYVDYDGSGSSPYATHFITANVIPMIYAEQDADVRASMWKTLYQQVDGSGALSVVHNKQEYGVLSYLILSCRLTDEKKKEYIKVIWSGREAELISNLGGIEKPSEYEKVLQFIDDPSALEAFLRKKRQDEPLYYHGWKSEYVAKRLAEIDKGKYVKYVLASSDFQDVKWAVDILEDEDALTAIVIKRCSEEPEALLNSSKKELLKRYLRKVRSEKFIFKVLESIDMDSFLSRKFLDALKDEAWLTKALCNGSIVDKVLGGRNKPEILNEYIDRIQKDENLESIVQRCQKLSFYALQSVKDQEFLYQVLLKNQSNEKVKEMLLGKLDDKHVKAYKKALDDAAKAAWHAKFDPLIKKAEAGDVAAMRQVAEDASERQDIDVALAWYVKICDADKRDGYACARAGDCYAEAKDGKRDLKKAREYYALAIARGLEGTRIKHTLVSIQLENPELSKDCLLDYTIRGRRPSKKCFFQYEGGEGFERLRVLQALPAQKAVLVKPAVDFGYEDMTDKKGILYIKTRRKYVDGEYLAAGIYLYDGPYTYPTAGGSTKTVYAFHEYEAKHKKLKVVNETGLDK